MSSASKVSWPHSALVASWKLRWALLGQTHQIGRYVGGAGVAYVYIYIWYHPLLTHTYLCFNPIYYIDLYIISTCIVDCRERERYIYRNICMYVCLYAGEGATKLYRQLRQSTYNTILRERNT